MRAVGFYPSEEEVSNMVTEVKYSKFMETGMLEEEIALNDFIKLYINHRPVLPSTPHRFSLLSRLSLKGKFPVFLASPSLLYNIAFTRH